MMAKIILLTGEIEADYLTNILSAINSTLIIKTVFTLEDLSSIAKPGDRLISFLSPFIVPEQILTLLEGNCYNFHPGSPDYPGYRPASFAIYQEAKTYGVTLHQMALAVDTGPIIKSRSFAVNRSWNYIDLSKESYLALFELFKEMAIQLSCIDQPLCPNREQWSHKLITKAAHTEKRRIYIDTSDIETKLRYKSFEAIFCPIVGN